MTVLPPDRAERRLRGYADEPVEQTRGILPTTFRSSASRRTPSTPSPRTRSYVPSPSRGLKPATTPSGAFGGGNGENLISDLAPRASWPIFTCLFSSRLYAVASWISDAWPLDLLTCTWGSLFSRSSSAIVMVVHNRIGVST